MKEFSTSPKFQETASAAGDEGVTTVQGDLSVKPQVSGQVAQGNFIGKTHHDAILEASVRSLRG